MQRQPDRLPRSLMPLPGEGLPGFLLRLAHRLDLTPLELMRQTNLIGHRRTAAPSRLLFMLERDELTGFCAATGLTPHDADRLTLRPYVSSYPPVTEALLGLRSLSTRPRGIFPTWLLTTSTRYCPSCLAGDGSAIQQRHGGPWKNDWRTATTFACPEHQVFLLATCPACGLPAQSKQSTGRALVTSPAVDGLHPAQCRNLTGPDRTVCGARLDSLSFHDLDRPSLTLIDVQSRLLHAFPYGTNGPGQDPMAALGRMTDLLVMTAFIRATWPLTAHHAPSERLAQALERDLKHSGPSPSLQGSYATTQFRWDSEPFSVHATAALLGIATHILNLPVSQFREELSPVVAQLPARDEPAWGRTWLMLKNNSSPLFRHEVDQTFRRLFPPPLPVEVSLPEVLSVRQRGYPAEAVPQWLPENWFHIVVASLGLRSPGRPPLRRAFAAHLVQAATGMSLNEATDYLGIPTAWLTSWQKFRPLTDHTHGRRTNLAEMFQSLADLVASRPLANYHARRQNYASWTVSPEHMQTIIEGYSGRRRYVAAGTQSGPRLHACFSAMAWSRLTGSEWRLSPSMQPPMTSPDGPTLTDDALISVLRLPPPKQLFYTYLHSTLRKYTSEVLMRDGHQP